MSLYVVATPIGCPEDLSPRAMRILSEARTVIVEDPAVGRPLLKSIGANPQVLTLNEHSRPEDLAELIQLCATATVALISDCGTPGFCDPGADLVEACRKAKIPVYSIPGVSSLMAFLSVCGRRLTQFQFLGFLPAESEQRRQTLQILKLNPEALIVMDTPYRLPRLLSDLAEMMPQRRLVLGLNLSTEQEQIRSGEARQLAAELSETKAEFVLLIEALSPQLQAMERTRSHTDHNQRKAGRSPSGHSSLRRFKRSRKISR